MLEGSKIGLGELLGIGDICTIVLPTEQDD